MFKKSGIFYGWWIIFAAFLILTVQAGTTFYSFGMLMKPLMSDFGWSRMATSTAQTICSLCSAFSGLFVGRIIPRINIKKILLTGAILRNKFVISCQSNTTYPSALYNCMS